MPHVASERMKLAITSGVFIRLIVDSGVTVDRDIAIHSLGPYSYGLDDRIT